MHGMAVRHALRRAWPLRYLCAGTVQRPRM